MFIRIKQGKAYIDISVLTVGQQQREVQKRVHMIQVLVLVTLSQPTLAVFVKQATPQEFLEHVTAIQRNFLVLVGAHLHTMQQELEAALQDQHNTLVQNVGAHLHQTQPQLVIKLKTKTVQQQLFQLPQHIIINTPT